MKRKKREESFLEEAMDVVRNLAGEGAKISGPFCPKNIKNILFVTVRKYFGNDWYSEHIWCLVKKRELFLISLLDIPKGEIKIEEMETIENGIKLRVKIRTPPKIEEKTIFISFDEIFSE